MYRALVRMTFCLVLLGVSICWSSRGVISSAHGLASLTEVQMLQATRPSLDFVPYVAALDQGYYARNGIAFVNRVGTSSGASTKIVGAGSVPIGLASISVVMQAIAVGVPITIVMTQDQEDPSAVCALKSSGIKTAKDLEGKSIATSPGSAPQVEISLAMKQAGLDPTTIRWVNMAPEERQPALVAKRVDATTCILTGSTLTNGLSLNTISVASLGLHVPFEAVFVNNDYLRQHSAIVRSFVRATLQGITYAVAHPAWAAAAVHKHYPVVKTSDIKKQWPADWSYLRSAATDRYGIGWNDKAQYQVLVGVLVKGGLLSHPLDVNKVFTNTILQSIPLSERQISGLHS